MTKSPRFRTSGSPPDPHLEREQLKADLTLQIYRLIRQRGLTAGAFSVEPLTQFLS